MEESTANTVVKVFAILDWIGAAGLIIGGIVALFMGPAILTYVSGDASGLAAVVGGLAMVLGVVIIALGVFMIFVGRGLWQHKNWARIITLIFAALGVLGIFSGNFLGAIIGAIQIWLFGFDTTVKGLFSK